MHASRVNPSGEHLLDLWEKWKNQGCGRTRQYYRFYCDVTSEDPTLQALSLQEVVHILSDAEPLKPLPAPACPSHTLGLNVS